MSDEEIIDEDDIDVDDVDDDAELEDDDVIDEEFDDEETALVVDDEAIVDDVIEEDEEEEDDEEELPEEAVNAADALARRAMVAALAGIFIPFLLHLYSVVLLAQFARLGTPASAKGRRHLVVAVALDALFLGPVLALAVRYFGA